MIRRKSGFTLIEVMIAVAIVGFVLAAASAFFIMSVRQYTVPSKIVETNVEGVLGLNDGTWRWCLKRAVFQFELPDTRHKKLMVDLTVPELTFRQTGPVKITVRVGSHVLDTLEFDKHGQRSFEKEVPAEWLVPEAPLMVSLEVDKLWRSPDDGAERGFILTRLGFVE